MTTFASFWFVISFLCTEQYIHIYIWHIPVCCNYNIYLRYVRRRKLIKTWNSKSVRYGMFVLPHNTTQKYDYLIRWLVFFLLLVLLTIYNKEDLHRTFQILVCKPPPRGRNSTAGTRAGGLSETLQYPFKIDEKQYKVDDYLGVFAMKEIFYLTTHSTHLIKLRRIYGNCSFRWWKGKTRCRHLMD